MKEKPQKTKENKQVSLDIEQYVSGIEQQLKIGFKGKIKEVTPITNTLYFKGAGSFDERDGISVVVVVDNDGQEFSNWFGKPNIRGWDQSNLYAFKKAYGSVPKVNMVVDVVIDDNGFYKIKY
jgi:hypothetical protein